MPSTIGTPRKNAEHFAAATTPKVLNSWHDQLLLNTVMARQHHVDPSFGSAPGSDSSLDADEMFAAVADGSSGISFSSGPLLTAQPTDPVTNAMTIMTLPKHDISPPGAVNNTLLVVGSAQLDVMRLAIHSAISHGHPRLCAARLPREANQRSNQLAAAELAGGVVEPTDSKPNISAIEPKLAIGRLLCRQAWMCSAANAG